MVNGLRSRSPKCAQNPQTANPCDVQKSIDRPVLAHKWSHRRLAVDVARLVALVIVPGYGQTGSNPHAYEQISGATIRGAQFSLAGTTSESASGSMVIRAGSRPRSSPSAST